MTSLNLLDTSSPNKTMTYFESIASRNPHPIPQTPNDLIEFRSLSVQKRMELGERFFQQEHIKKFIEDKWKSELFNRDSLILLKDYKNEILNNQEKERELRAINIKIEQFEKAMKSNPNIFESLKI